eukprot:COSAG02_NODE_66764_length_254_cov_1.283871_1_plen_51_part_01
MPVLSPPVSVPREAVLRKPDEQQQYSAVDEMIKRQRQKTASQQVAKDGVAR